MLDLAIYETGNGGDLVLTSSDLEGISSIYNMIYLAWFGGNVQAVTRGDEKPGEERFDYWANSLLWRDEPGIQFNSQLEKVLNESDLSSSTRVKIEEVAKSDLKFLEEFGDVDVTTRILGIDRLEITATILEPGQTENRVFRFIWDATKAQLIIDWPAGIPFTYPKRNILINGIFNGSTNWTLVNILAVAVAVFDMTCKITIGAVNHILSVYSTQLFTPGKTYRIRFECITFGVDSADNWGVGFASVAPTYQREGDFILVNGVGIYSQELTAPENPADPENLRMVINTPLANGSAGDFEIKKLTVKAV